MIFDAVRTDNYECGMMNVVSLCSAGFMNCSFIAGWAVPTKRQNTFKF